ncbi:hypothetical protein UFOVP215_26 [uncultured Caudovirales phage]|uniref:Uncharacterized protein n=1 Tax=uncultured Caudovirales phage TaxID=2100421 RepID=A0A6J7WL73_9CAUD|nr:hypothetical protein UFOVP215_26 [uncultured Caudovirales phage]
MIILTKGETKNIYFTGSESSILSDPYFLFIFTNRITQEIVKFVVTNESITLRYDSFELDVDQYFQDAETGFWTYQVYEQESSSNLNPTGLNEVENGYMYLNSAIVFVPTTYNEQDNSFITYNG